MRMRDLLQDGLQPQLLQTCVAVARRARRCILLTGTPSLSRPFDLFRQVSCSARQLRGAPERTPQRPCPLPGLHVQPRTAACSCVDC